MTLPEILHSAAVVTAFLIAPILGVYLFLAILGKRVYEGVYCAHCGYNRHSLKTTRDCPECGARGVPSNIKEGSRLRSCKTIFLRFMLLAIAAAGAYGANTAGDYLASTADRFTDALYAKDHQTVKSMLDRHPELSLGQDPYDPQAYTRDPLHNAIILRDDKLVGMLIDVGLSQRADYVRNQGDALTTAMQFGTLSAFETLIENGADPNQHAVYNPILIDAINFKNQTRYIELLLEYGADVNAKGATSTALIRAQYRQDAPLITKMLLEKGANPNAVGNLEDFPPLYIAIRKQHPKSVQLLIEAGADANARWGHELSHQPSMLEVAIDMDEKNSTPDSREIIEMLERAGAE